MKLVPCEISGLLRICPDVYGDSRGFFLESWNRARYVQAGIDAEFVQDNLSMSRQGTLRGLHYQNPHPQAKLVQVLLGEVFDVAVDLRRSSPTFGKWHGLILSAETKEQFYIPAGFAHGFVVLSEMALFHYKCTEYYLPKNEMTLRWDDPQVGIHWPVKDPLLSSKDAQGGWLANFSPEQLFG